MKDASKKRQHILLLLFSIIAVDYLLLLFICIRNGLCRIRAFFLDARLLEYLGLGYTALCALALFSSTWVWFSYELEFFPGQKQYLYSHSRSLFFVSSIVSFVFSLILSASKRWSRALSLLNLAIAATFFFFLGLRYPQWTHSPFEFGSYSPTSAFYTYGLSLVLALPLYGILVIVTTRRYHVLQKNSKQSPKGLTTEEGITEDRHPAKQRALSLSPYKLGTWLTHRPRWNTKESQVD